MFASAFGLVMGLAAAVLVILLIAGVLWVVYAVLKSVGEVVSAPFNPKPKQDDPFADLTPEEVERARELLKILKEHPAHPALTLLKNHPPDPN